MVRVKNLSNGIKVVTEKLSHYRSATFGVWVQVGSVNESKDENGLAHMLEHMFFKGTKRHSTKELADRIALIGDDVNAFTSKEYTSYYGTTTTEHIPELIELLGEMLLESEFHEVELEKEKRVILDEIDMYEDSPDDLVHDRIQSGVFHGHPLSYMISGDKKSVKKYTRSDLIAFKDRFYTSGNMILSIAGNFDEEAAIESMEKWFGKIAEGGLHTDLSEYAAPVYTPCFCNEYKDIEQVYMNMAFPSICSGSEDRYAFMLLNSLIGGSNNSRLFQNIREQSGLAYSIYSYTSKFRNAGLFHIDAIVNPSQIFKVYDMIVETMNDLKHVGVTEEELKIHKSQTKVEFIMGSETTESKMNHNAKSLFLSESLYSLDANLDRINAVTVEEMNMLLREYFCMDTASICIVGAKAGLKKQQFYDILCRHK